MLKGLAIDAIPWGSVLDVRREGKRKERGDGKGRRKEWEEGERGRREGKVREGGGRREKGE